MMYLGWNKVVSFSQLVTSREIPGETSTDKQWRAICLHLKKKVKWKPVRLLKLYYARLCRCVRCAFDCFRRVTTWLVCLFIEVRTARVVYLYMCNREKHQSVMENKSDKNELSTCRIWTCGYCHADEGCNTYYSVKEDGWNITKGES